MLRKAIVTAVCAIAVVGMSASAAFAGEITGNGKPTQGPAHANSICVFSGQNDDPGAPIVSADPTPEAPNGPGGSAIGTHGSRTSCLEARSTWIWNLRRGSKTRRLERSAVYPKLRLHATGEVVPSTCPEMWP